MKRTVLATEPDAVFATAVPHESGHVLVAYRYGIPVREISIRVRSEKGLSPKTIENYIQVPKMVVASVVDADGNQVYPRKWNHDFIDMPIVEPPEQNRPSFSSEIMARLAKYQRPREQMLFILGGPADSVLA